MVPVALQRTTWGTPADDRTQDICYQQLAVTSWRSHVRSSFRDWAAEQTDHPREVIEAALAHTIPNKVKAAYARSTLLDRRRALMCDWAAFLARG